MMQNGVYVYLYAICVLNWACATWRVLCIFLLDVRQGAGNHLM